MIKSVLIVALLMRVVDVYKVVEVVFILTFGGPGLETELLALHVYKVAVHRAEPRLCLGHRYAAARHRRSAERHDSGGLEPPRGQSRNR